jgi:hypothetical protein
MVSHYLNRESERIPCPDKSGLQGIFTLGQRAWLSEAWHQIFPAYILLDSAQKNNIPAPTEIALSATLNAGQ